MKRILASVVLLFLLFPALASGETMDDLVERDGLFYTKLTDVPFSGKTTGKIQGTFKNGKKDGPWVYNHPTGQLWSKGTLKDGEKDGFWVYYRENGQLFYKGPYKDGEKDGLWIFYHDDGQVDSKGTYKNGKKDGLWVFYHEDGTVWEKFTGTFKDGVKVD